MRKKFSFLYPIKERKVDPQSKFSLQYENVANLLVSGVAYEKDHRVLDNIQPQYIITISEILYNGVNVSSLLAAFDSIENIIAACKNYIRDIFNKEESVNSNESFQMNTSLAKVISFPLKRKIN